ncbi:AfsR/SARP family transcriptional regulator [Pseudarthrobacter sp. P1]|uniref:AfsR/SARP family transcriptional regulator n=1 Tax=Pseudarthrobacter sp. P1 TaxID=3418418 RepID=UPI003CE712EE
MAGILWPFSPEAQAASSLRAAVFNVCHQLPAFLCSTHDSIFLAPHVTVDYHRIGALITAIEESGGEAPPDSTEVLYRANLLPGWYDDWIVFEQERLQQRKLAAMEAMAGRSLAQGDACRALDTASLAAAIEPLRESAQAIIIRSHLKLGNRAMALRSFTEYRELLRRELDIQPSVDLAGLLAFEPDGLLRPGEAHV